MIRLSQDKDAEIDQLIRELWACLETRSRCNDGSVFIFTDATGDRRDYLILEVKKELEHVSKERAESIRKKFSEQWGLEL